MALNVYELTLKGFEYPAALNDSRRNFRFTATVRYTDKDGSFKKEDIIRPGADLWWECDGTKNDKPNYVRDDNVPTRFDMGKIDDWNKLVICVKGNSIRDVQIRVYDVDRKDVWDRIQAFFSDFVTNLIGRATQALPTGPIVSLASSSLGSAIDEFQTYVVSRINGGDSLLFIGSTPLVAGDNKIGGVGPFAKGVKGDYTIHLNLDVKAIQ